MKPNGLEVRTEAHTVGRIGCDACPNGVRFDIRGLAGMACTRTLDAAGVPYRVLDEVETYINNCRVGEPIRSAAWRGVDGGTVEACSSACVGESRIDKAKAALSACLGEAIVAGTRMNL